jgi:hypothetical protein
MVMLGEEIHLKLLNEIIQEAVGLHGQDAEKIADYVKKKIKAAAPEDRLAIERILTRILSFQAPDHRSEPIN